MECIKKNLFLLKRKNTTVVLLTGSVGSVLEKHSWINYIFIFCTHSSLRACASLVSHPSALYEKLQDYSDALDAPLGMSHLLRTFVGLMFFLLESHMKSFKSTGYQVWGFFFILSFKNILLHQGDFSKYDQHKYKTLLRLVNFSKNI